MSLLAERKQTVGVAETTSGGLISAALWSSPVGGRAFKGAGRVRHRACLYAPIRLARSPAVAAPPPPLARARS